MKWRVPLFSAYSTNYYFGIIAIITIIGILSGIYLNSKLIQLLPLSMMVILMMAIDYKRFYWLLMACIPISIVHDFSPSLSTDFPTEFISIGLMGFFIIDSMFHPPNDLDRLFSHKISLGLSILLFWAIICTVSAKIPWIAIKYCLAKCWYIVAYFILTYRMVYNFQMLKRLFWVIFIPLLFTTIYSFVRTAIGHFDFELTSEFSLPFYENHVLYATTMSIFLPFLFLARTWYFPGTLVRIFLNVSIIVFLLAIYFSYTRACYIALIVALIVLIIIHWNKIIVSISLISISVILTLFYFSHQYYYLKLAPDFTKTIMHPEFKDHVLATFQGKDASSMERINMWVSVFRMSVDYPWTGVGPNNFPFWYKPYSVLYFKTWVSDNPLHLSCHNYFWLMIAEQGYIGCFLFLAFVLMVYYYLQQYYQRQDSSSRNIVITLAAAFTILLVNLMFSDLIETSKNGSLFFILLGLIIRIRDASFMIENNPNNLMPNGSY